MGSLPFSTGRSEAAAWGFIVPATKMKVVHLLDLLPEEEEYAYFNDPKEGFLTHQTTRFSKGGR
jgi:hypothetical protein